jgi:hypothetical protein
MNVMLKLLNSVEKYDKIRNASKGANDIDAMKNITSIEEIIKSHE